MEKLKLTMNFIGIGKTIIIISYIRNLYGESRVTTSPSNSPPTKTKINIPPIKPAPKRLAAVLRAPPIAFLHNPISLELIVRNHHPTRTALLSVSLDTSVPPDNNTEGFFVAGIRSARIPLLLPGKEEKVQWRLIPVMCGDEVMLPKIRVVNVRNSSRVEEDEGQTNVAEEPVPLVYEWTRQRIADKDAKVGEGEGDDSEGTQAQVENRLQGFIRVLPNDYS